MNRTTHLLHDAMKGIRALEYAQSLDKEITAKQRTEWGKGTLEEWANESLRVAVETAYAGMPKDGAPPTLDRDYVTKGITATEARLKRAGVRLAWFLNTALGDK